MKDICLIGGDARSFWAANYFEARGCTVRAVDVPQYDGEALPERLQCAVLPFPSFRGEAVRGQTKLTAEELISRVDSGSTVFGGLLGAYRAAFEARGARVFDCYGTEPLTTANAVPTAEGAIALAMNASPVTLHGARCLVIGFGRVGKVLAQKLHALSARVTVAARSPADRALAEAFGMRGDVFGEYPRGLGYDFVFNTAPTEVFTRAQLAQLPQGCIFIELASRPHGISEADCAAFGSVYRFAPGLPGKCAPKTAGELYAQCILDCLEKEEAP